MGAGALDSHFMKRILIGTVLVLAVAGGVYFLRQEPALEKAHCAERKVSLWNRVAQVREPVATLIYGEEVSILQRRRENFFVRTARGAEGWIDEKYLMPPELWLRGMEVRAKAAGMKSQARATTKVATNVRSEPGRTGPKLFQFSSGASLDVLARQVVEWTPPATASAPAEAETPLESGTGAISAAFPEKRYEDWLLVRGTGGEGQIAGWVLARFLALDYPSALRDYAGGIRFLAWFELTATPSAEGPRPTYLAVGVDGAEGQSCDFTLLRVYSWNPKRRRYETAYVEGALCGSLPVEVRRSADLQLEATFRFANNSKKGLEQREYRTRQNVVRPVRG